MSGSRKDALGKPSESVSPIEGAPLFSLFNKLVLLADGAPSYAIEIIGSRAGAGVSSIAQALAAFATLNVDGPVLLLNVDPTAGNAASRASGIPSLSEVLGRGGDIGQAIAPTGHAGLFVARLARAMGQEQPPTVTISMLEQVISRLRQRYRWIIVDSAPTNASYYALILSRFVDGTVIVAESERTRLPIVQEMVNQIRANGGRPIGMIINKRRVSIPNFIYKFL